MDEERDQLLLLELEPLQVVALVLDLGVQLAALGRQPAQLERGLDPRHQLVGPERLGQEVIAAGEHRAIECLDVAQRGDEHHRDVAAAGQRADPLAGRRTVDPGHPDVEQHAVGPVAHERGDAGLPIAGEHDAVAIILERRLGERAVLGVVVDHEDGGT